MAITGPGAQPQVSENPEPLLWNATNDNIVKVFNPLTDDFAGLVGQTRPTNDAFKIRKTEGLTGITENEKDAASVYGLSLKNPDHQAKTHIATQIVIPAGATKNLQGGAAKVIVTQLVNEIMQRRGNTLKMADPTARLEVEREVVKGISSVSDLMSDGFVSEDDQVQAAISKSNEDTDEQAFPSERGSTAVEDNPGAERTPVAAGSNHSRQKKAA